ncbi:hypothetical protein CA833_03560 [Novosphingobium sp. KA1]|nr:hypothetical protein CA833_03560 [Novosphingobium sp. KA1]
MDASSTDSKAATGTAVPADKPVEAAKPAAVPATPVPPAAATPTPVVAAAPKEASAPKAPAKPEVRAKPAAKAKPIAKGKPAAKVKVAAKPIVKGPAAKVPAPKLAPKPAPKPVAAKAIKPAAAPKAGTTRIIAKPAVATPLAATPTAAAATRPTAAAAARPAPAKIAPAKAGATKPAPAKPGISSFAGLISNFMLEDTTMDMSANLSAFQDAVADAQTKAKAAFEKGTGALGELGDFTKGNLEAVVESGKILAEGLQGLGSELVSEGRTSFATMTGDIKELAAVKSPTDFFKLQGDIARKNFDSAVAYSSKNSEAMLKLMSDVMAPLSGRVSIAMEKVRHAAV